MIRRILALALLLVARPTDAQGRVGIVALLLVLVFAAAPLEAQVTVAGVAVDSITGAPLRCVDVTQQDTAGRVVARTLTASDGSFRLQTTTAPHELQFAVWNRAPTMRATLSADSATGRPRSYALMFENALPESGLFWPDTVDSPPGRPVNFPRLSGVSQLARQNIAAIAVVRFAVESSGRVDRSSIQVLESSHKMWERSVLDFLRDVEYAPARRNGQAVCALVYAMPFNFNAHP